MSTSSLQDGAGAAATARGPSDQTLAPPVADWRSVVARYERPDPKRAATQLMTTILPLIVTFVLMYQALAVSYWLTLALMPLAAGLLVRTFIIMHDCAHRSFLPWSRLNDFIGVCTGVVTLTPFEKWRREHARHHASSGDLDRRGHGDIPTLTVAEYLARSPWGRFRYRAFRHPATILGLGPLHMIVLQRLRSKGVTIRDRETSSVWMTNALILAVFTAFAVWLGPIAVLLVYVPAMYVAAIGGVWLFYVQHQFEDAYWKDHKDWDYATAAIRGSSYFKLPIVLRWLTGNIGLHHVHHLGPRIPNYRLQRAHDENALFHDVTVLTLGHSVHTLWLSLWDEDRQQLVSFAEVARRAAMARA